MNFLRMKLNNGDLYYVGEGYNGPNAFVPNGIGALSQPNEKLLTVCEEWSNKGANGLGYYYYSDLKSGAMGTFENGNMVGPCMEFGYESHLTYKNYLPNGKARGFIIYVFYNGNYIIYEENSFGIYQGVAYYDGNLYFVTLGSDFTILDKKFIDNIGSEYKFTTVRMFAMGLEATRPIVNTNGKTAKGLGYDKSYQALTEYSRDKAHGFGAIIWDGGTHHVGEWYDGNREGLGWLVYENGNTYIGKFYNNLRSGNMLSSADGVVRFGNYKGGKRKGISFEIYADCVIIENYDDGEFVGDRYKIKSGCQEVVQYNEYYTKNTFRK